MMLHSPRVLVVDDDPSWLEQVPLILEDECAVDGFPTIDQGLSAVQAQFYDVILLDLNFGDDTRSGLHVFRQFQALDNGADIVVISGETNHVRLIELFNAGVSQFVSKPCQPDQIRQAVKRALENRETRLKALNLAATRSGKQGPLLHGSSQCMQKIKAEIARIVINGTRDILLCGETGTGKEVVARLIAHQSDSSRRFVAVHCGAISDGLVESELFGHVKGAFTGADRDKVGAFEAAGGGFVFLDEIGEMPLNQQAKLLRVLQERKVQRVGSIEERAVSFRVIAATHVDLEKAMIERTFREDLYYRIAKEKIRIPSLSERVEDIPEIVYSTLAQTPEHRKKTFTHEAMGLLQAYSWPGNVRQLIAVVESLSSRCEGDVIREKDVCQVLPEVARVLSTRITRVLVGRYGASLISNEKKRFEQAIIEANGDRNHAAKILGLSRATFFRKAKDLGLVKSRREAF